MSILKELGVESADGIERGPRIRWRLESATDGADEAAEVFHPAELLEAGRVCDVELAYTSRPGGGRTFGLSMLATSAASLDEDVAETGAYVGQRLATVANLARFVRTDGEDRQPLQHTFVPVPLAFAVPVRKGRRPAGFGRQPHAPTTRRVLASPPLVKRGGIKSFTRLSRDRHLNLEMRIGFSRVRLSVVELEQVSRAIAVLAEAQAIEWPAEHGQWRSVTSEIAVEMARAALTRWLLQPTGYRVSCELHADAALGEAQIRDVWTDLFPGIPVVDCRASAGPDDAVRPASVLDLSGCLHDLDPLPAWLPSGSSLERTGIRRQYPEPTADFPPGGVLVGRCGGTEVRIGDGDRLRHLFVCGGTGTGKTTLIRNMAQEDIEDGRGTVVVDPHGDLHADLLESIPSARIDDVVILDPTIEDWSVGLNFLECSGPNRRMQVGYIVNEIIMIFEALYDMRVCGGPVFEAYMRNTLLLLLQQPEGYGPLTLPDVSRVFEDKDFRRSLLAHCTDPIVTAFWTKQAERAGGEANLSNVAPYITSKLNQFISNPLLRPMIAQPRSTIDLRRILDEQKILLVNLSRGRLGRLDSRLLGMIVIGRIFLAAMSRADTPTAHRAPSYVYIDEFQDVMTDTAQIFAEGRKYGLGLTVANQTLSQLTGSDGQVLNAVLGNCGSLVLFRLGVVDAERLERYVQPELSARDLQELPDFHAAGRLLVRNRPTRGFVFRSSEPQPRVECADPEAVVASSLSRYARPTFEVEAEIRQLRERDPFAEQRPKEDPGDPETEDNS